MLSFPSHSWLSCPIPLSHAVCSSDGTKQILGFCDLRRRGWQSAGSAAAREEGAPATAQMLLLSFVFHFTKGKSEDGAPLASVTQHTSRVPLNFTSRTCVLSTCVALWCGETRLSPQTGMSRLGGRTWNAGVSCCSRAFIDHHRHTTGTLTTALLW